ncbi:MAG: phosphoribosyl-AMP cyclohydrolase [Candidatus Caenarcaniphilales bacterium]|nr:phosphoribosyl-AMP cyclohydrolase [Candidatus Caenarcaniphilales bacterium]
MKIDLINQSEFLDRVKFDLQGLVPVIAQSTADREVLMLAYMNHESLLQTIETGLATYWSRSRQAIWVKGETSGHLQKVKEILLDCDGDTILLKVDQIGPACHTGTETCFFRSVDFK